jgi:hypothetical protein
MILLDSRLSRPGREMTYLAFLERASSRLRAMSGQDVRRTEKQGPRIQALITAAEKHQAWLNTLPRQ